MKKAELTFAAISVPVDYIMLVLAGITAYQIRYAGWVQDIRPVVFDLLWLSYIQIVLGMAFIWLVVFALQGLYTVSFHRRMIDQLWQIVFACSTGLMIIVVYIFWQREFFDSRFIILAGWVLAILYVAISRIFLRLIRRWLLQRGWGVSRVVIIGNDKASHDLAAMFHRQPFLGYRVVERLVDFSQEKLVQILADHTVDEVILAESEVQKGIKADLLDFCHSYQLGFQYVADVFDAQAHNVDIRSIAGMPLIEIKKTPLDGWGRISKRLFDIIFGLLLFILFLPLGIIISLIVVLDTPGQALVRLPRVGKNRKIFNLYKFRSMIKNAHSLKYDKTGNLRSEFRRLNERSDGPLFKNEKDRRITASGRWLRFSSLDEIPQLINVLRGQMSLVGPRPHEPEEVNKYEQHQKKLLSVKPGMTGLAQVSGRSNLSFQEEVKLDLYYIENWSLRNDLQILFKTIWVVLKRKGVA